jgi:hypothetical protein
MAYGNDNERVVQPFAEPTEGAPAGRLWHKRLDKTIVWRQDHPFADKQWERNTALDRGYHWEEDRRGVSASSDNPRERITVNITGSYVRDFIAFLFKHTPEFLCRPRTKDGVVSARLQQELVNYWWKEKNWKKQAKRAVRDLVTLGTAVIRTGWVLEVDASATPDEHGDVEYHDAVKADEPLVRRISPARFLLDHTAPEHDLASARWCAEVFHKSLSDILVTEKYDEEVRRQIEIGRYRPKRIKKDDEKEKEQLNLPFSRDEAMGDDHCASHICRLYEVWDKKYKRHYILLDGVEEPLLAENWPFPYLDGFPYVLAVYDELNDEIYGLGLPFAMEDQQLELNRIRTAEFQHRRDYGRARLQIQRNALDPAELAKLQAGHDGDVVVNVAGAISPIETPTLPADNYKVEEIIHGDVRNLIGADQLTSGANLPSRTSATEVNARSQYTGMKIEMRVEVVDEFLTEITRQVLQHMKAHMDVPQAVRIQGAEGQAWAMVGKTDIQADVDLEITTVSAERTNRDMQRQQAIQVMQHLLTNSQALQMQGHQVNVPRLLQWVLEEHFQVREYSEFVTPVDPMMAAAGGGGGGGAPGSVPGIPPEQQAAQMGAVNPMSMAQGGMGALGG